MRRFLLYCILLSVPAIASAAPEVRDSVVVDARAMADSLIARAELFLGTPYVWAANGPKAFDCTGYTKYLYAGLGYKLGRTVPAQAKDGRVVEGGFENLQKGDILIFGKRDNKKRMGHVALYIGPDESGDNFRFIHAAKPRVIISEIKQSYYRERFLGAVRILPDFVPEATADSVDLSFAETAAVVAPDTLKLGPDDRRIVLLDAGGWAFVGPDGSLSAPQGDDAIVLYADGQWRNVKVSTKKIPVIDYEQATAASAKPEVGAEGAVYHTIKSGDTLSGLAVRYHTTVDALCRLNGITRTTILRLDKKIRVK